MADNWYYVQKGNRQGPVAVEVIEAMVTKLELKPDDYVWKKGFENWKKIKDCSELKAPEPVVAVAPSFPDVPEEEDKESDVSLLKLNPEDRAVFIRIGNDRGVASSDYGPYSIKQLKQLYKENRINGKTYVFTKGMQDFKVLGDFPEYEQIFEELPPVIHEIDRRSKQRKPFVARLFIQNNKNVFEGICRDVSVGGMQVLMDEYKGKAGDTISINVHPENTEYHFTASGVVVRILEGNSGFSFRFDKLSDEARSCIEKYVVQN
ncbi:MAG TPA: GYF domain-containing protein [Bacteriovoracaceae bacterium]|nr:GYF domain-containing protein [Bacteriovoracaceae bacterium]